MTDEEALEVLTYAKMLGYDEYDLEHRKVHDATKGEITTGIWHPAFGFLNDKEEAIQTIEDLQAARVYHDRKGS